MTTRITTLLAGAALALGVGTGAAFADPSGTWTTDSGLSQVQIAPCGNAYCGTVVWTKDPDRKDVKSGKPVKGMTILTGLAETGPNQYQGKIYNPQDGRNYSGYMTISGNAAQLKGCVVRPLCKTQTWTR